MAYLQTTTDLITDILFRSGENTDATSDFQPQALTYLNRAYREVWMGGGAFEPKIDEDWWWLRATTFTTLFPVITGTATLAHVSTALTFSAVPLAFGFVVSLAGWFIRFGSTQNLFRVDTHVAGDVAATVKGIYRGPAGPTPFTAYDLEHVLVTDRLRIIAPLRISVPPYRIPGTSLLELERRWPVALVTAGTPALFAPVNETAVRFSHATDLTDGLRVEVDYLQRPADLVGTVGEEPVVPIQFRHVLSDIAIFYILTDKNDSRAQTAGVAARALLGAMAAENRRRTEAMDDNYGQLLARTGDLDYNLRQRRTESGLIIG